MVRIIKLCSVAILILAVFSCVPVRKYEEIKDKKQKCDKERDELKSQNETLTAKINELNSEIEKIKKIINPLLDDTTIRGRAYRTLTSQYNQVEAQYELLYKNFERLKKEHDEQEKKIKDKLFSTQDGLIKTEDDLKKTEMALNEQKNKLDALKKDLDLKDSELQRKDSELKKQGALLDEKSKLLDEKTKKINELQAILDKKDADVKALKDKVSGALLGFENKGLTVHMKNGKVYVSLEESLLFASGSYKVSDKGAEALKNLAKVLEANADISVMVEGHTDNVPYNGTNQLKDNWDLSVMRSTSVVKILTSNKVDPKRIMATGRGEYFPLEEGTTKEIRAKNRRTEIILTPKLDELFKVLENN